MIGHLRGTLLSKKPYQILLDVNGVGYELRVPYSTSQLPATGKELALVVHTHVREDSITLYAFKTPAERDTFEQLLTVKNVGPKMALMALAGLTPQDISTAVRRSNPMALIVPGIGPKTAERIAQELRGRLQPVEEAAPAGPPLSEAAEEAVSALENMGCDPKLAARAVREVLQSSEQLAASSSRLPRAESRGAQARDPLVSFEAVMKGALQWLREKRR
ncbi:MAG: Holliday junction branch migration protein RuvA [Acidobacteria bacterium]|nr:Holliday junction branch migration protein RuvA [Acidobacteriota bacterium]